MWGWINFYHLAPPHAAHILHLIPNAHSKNSTNTKKELLTPQPLCFSVGNSFLSALLSLVLMTLALESELTAVSELLSASGA